MNDSERLAEWLRYLKACRLRLNGLLAIQEKDPKLMPEIMKTLGLKTAMELLTWCKEVEGK